MKPAKSDKNLFRRADKFDFNNADVIGNDELNFGYCDVTVDDDESAAGPLADGHRGQVFVF